jgi:hypothetical protein
MPFAKALLPRVDAPNVLEEVPNLTGDVPDDPQEFCNDPQEVGNNPQEFSDVQQEVDNDITSRHLVNRGMAEGLEILLQFFECEENIKDDQGPE